MQENQGPHQWLLAYCEKLSNRLDFSSGFLSYGLLRFDVNCAARSIIIVSTAIRIKPERRQLVHLQFFLGLVALDGQEDLFR
ncbi:hypothetical protein TNCV_4003741 [Trichonephila clavipes]|nr:hypothetical protein TNCV_4003741 [Trichonephila clavipes]